MNFGVVFPILTPSLFDCCGDVTFNTFDVGGEYELLSLYNLSINLFRTVVNFLFVVALSSCDVIIDFINSLSYV